MRIRALIKRICEQMLRDKRTLALLFLAPLLVLSLMHYLFNHTGDAADAKIGVVGLPPQLTASLEQQGQAATSPKPGVTVEYVYGSENTTFFDTLSPILIGFFVFFFVFLISGIGLLRERTTGTLERLMSTPVRRGEVITGYLAGYGIFAFIQTVIVVIYATMVLGMNLSGSIWYVLLTNLLLAFVALSLGILLSTFAASEFQMVQFIPLVIIPQIFFAGIFPLEHMDTWVQVLARIMPLYYGADALKSVMYKGLGFPDIAFDLSVLVLFAALFILLNIVALRKYRKL